MRSPEEQKKVEADLERLRRFGPIGKAYEKRILEGTYIENEEIKKKDIEILEKLIFFASKRDDEDSINKKRQFQGLLELINLSDLPPTVRVTAEEIQAQEEAQAQAEAEAQAEVEPEELEEQAEPEELEAQAAPEELEAHPQPTPLTQFPVQPQLEESEDLSEDTPIIESSLKYKYDPEFGNQVSDRKQMILLLKKALKNLELEERAQEKLGVYTIPKTLYELLINYVLNKDIDLSSILSIQFNGWNKTRSRTSIFEALWILVIGLGFLERFPIENIQLVDWRNVNKEMAPEVFKSASNSSKLENILNILKGMPFGTRAGGVSDITFFYNEKPSKEGPIYKSGCGKDSCQEKQLVNKVFISSVKFFELDIKKNIDKFDIAPLIAATEILLNEKQDYEILLFVKDNKAVSNIVDQARKRYLANKVKPHNIFGESTLLSSLYSLRGKILDNITTDIPTTLQIKFGKEEAPKSYLQLRFHQELIVEKTYNYINTTKDSQKTVLIGVLPRGGKTYICGGIVSKLKPSTVLVLTHVPKETNKQFINDLFDNFADFSDYTIKYLKDDLVNEDYIPGKKYIIFTSYQLLKKGYSNKREGKEIKKKLLKALVDKSLVPDVCFLDEAHFGSAGSEAQEIYKTFDTNTIRILMTATYIKPYYLFNIKPEQLFFWDYRDIQLGKKLNNSDMFTEFRNRHLLEGELSESSDTVFDKVLENQSLKGNNIEEIQKIYSKFPDIEIIDSVLEDKAVDEFKDQLLDDGSKGFSMEAILAINSKKDIPLTLGNAYTLFNNPSIVGKFLNYIQPREGSYLERLGSGEDVSHMEGDLGNHFNIMDRIYEDSYLSGNRLTRGEPHTQIWFIPPSNGIQKRILALASLLLSHPWFSENFCVIGVSGGESDKIAQPDEKQVSINIVEFTQGKCLNIACASSNDLKECIESNERKNRCAAKPKGTIVLTGFMLRMGISLGCADVVMLFDDDEHPDSTIQKQFRALTESEGKKKAYVVDLNPRRSINAVYKHIAGVKQSVDKKSDKIYQTILNTFGINSDRFLFASPGGKPINYAGLLSGIKEIHESMPVSKNLRDLEESADKLTKSFNDAEIDKILRDDFMQSYMSSMDIKKQKEKGGEREDNGLGGTGRKRIVTGTRETDENNSSDENVSNLPIVPAKAMTLEERFNVFKKIIDTTLKVIAFSYNAKTSHEVYTLIQQNDEVQELVYNTLVSRGLVSEIMISGHKRTKKGILPQFSQEEKIIYERVNDEQKSIILEDILRILDKMTDKKTNMVYRVMKEKAEDKSVDQQKILKYIDDNLAPTAELKDQFGEVFTPMKLVNEMLDSLESVDPHIFEDKEKTWLDPANGMGNFPVALFYRLMQNLKGVSRDPQERAEYIVKNMLYMVELQKENSAKARRIFKKLAPGVDANILTANTLNEFLVKKGTRYIKSFGEGEPTTFDVIMGNPPFNPAKGDTGSSGNNIWPNFVMKSYSLLKENGYLLLVHPPGWKKPTDEIFKDEKFSSGDYTGQIRQGQVWQVLKNSGVFKYIYTNDKTSKGEDFLPHFPAVDYYVYQRGGDKSGCDTKNVFLGTVEEPKEVKLNYNLKYLPNLITKQTQYILHKITSREGDKPSFAADRKLVFGKTLFPEESKGPYKYIYTATKKGPIYAYSRTKIDNVDEDKVVMNFDGGIDAYFVEFIDSTKHIGSAHKSMYSTVESHKEGKRLEKFFKTDIVKFIFLITQYASGQRTQNEPLVANSLTIPPEGEDYYKFFGIEEYKKYIEDTLAHYAKYKAPKRTKTEKVDKAPTVRKTKKKSRI